MSDHNDDATRDTQQAQVTTNTYKVIGDFAAADGAGVLGKNTASSGTPIGVEGAVPNSSSGYGLSTPHDARVGGTAELAGLAGALTGGQEVTDLTGSGLTVNAGALEATGGGSGLWEDAGDNGLLNPKNTGDTGIAVGDVRTDTLADNGSGAVTTGSTLDLAGNDITGLGALSGASTGNQTVTDLLGNGMAVSGTSLGIAASGVGTPELASGAVTSTKLADGAITASDLATPYADLATLVGTPVTAAGTLDMGPSGAIDLNTDDAGGSYARPGQGHLFFGMATDDAALLFGEAGSGGDNDGQFVVRTQDDGDEEIKLQQHDSSNGVSPVTQLRIDESGNTRINNDLLTQGGTTIWNATNGYVPRGRLQNDSVTVAGNTVSLGGSTGVDYVNLADTGSSFPIPSSDLATPFSDLSTLFGSPVTAGADIDLAGNGIQSDGSVSIDIDANDDGSSETFTVTTDGGTTTLVTVEESGTVDVSGGRVDVTDNIDNQFVVNREYYPLFVENADTSDGNLVLGLKTGYTGPPQAGHNFVQFLSPDGSGGTDYNGTIQGDGSGGVTLKTSGADYAEYLPLRDPDEAIEAGDVVGVFEGEISHRTEGATRALVVSDAPNVAGNAPDDGDTGGYEPVAFTGQVSVKLCGTVADGDLVVPSGESDGTAVALGPDEYEPGTPVVGQAWDGTDEQGVDEVTVAVGIDDPGTVATALADDLDRQAGRLADLEAENDSLREENEALRDENDQLRERVAAIERELGLDGADSTAVADD